MRIAMPLAEGKLSPHFGHCEEFALVDVDPNAGKVVSEEIVASPKHEPGLLPRWLASQSVAIVIAGGMGHRAQQLFAERGITVVAGAAPEKPEVLALRYIKGEPVAGENVCDH